MKKAKITAICGMMAALSVVLMLITYIVPVFMYVLPLITGLIVLFTAEVSDKKWALGVYFSVSVLSLVLLADKESALTYILFFGYYPLVREFFEKLPKLLCVVLKFLHFNIAALCIGFLGVLVFGVSGEEYSEFGKLTVPILLAMANAAFILYDIALKKRGAVISLLAVKFKKRIK